MLEQVKCVSPSTLPGVGSIAGVFVKEASASRMQIEGVTAQGGTP
jgi:hypothetical protein